MEEPRSLFRVVEEREAAGEEESLLPMSAHCVRIRTTELAQASRRARELVPRSIVSDGERWSRGRIPPSLPDVIPLVHQHKPRSLPFLRK